MLLNYLFPHKAILYNNNITYIGQSLHKNSKQRVAYANSGWESKGTSTVYTFKGEYQRILPNFTEDEMRRHLELYFSDLSSTDRCQNCWPRVSRVMRIVSLISL